MPLVALVVVALVVPLALLAAWILARMVSTSGAGGTGASGQIGQSGQSGSSGGEASELARLASTPGIVILRPRSSYAALPTMIGMALMGAELARRGLVLEVLDVSREGGGPFPPHVSHRTGRDVDARYLDDDAAMIAAMIAARPKLVLTSRGRVEKYKSAGLPAIFWPGHTNHVHLRF